MWSLLFQARYLFKIALRRYGQHLVMVKQLQKELFYKFEMLFILPEWKCFFFCAWFFVLYDGSPSTWSISQSCWVLIESRITQNSACSHKKYFEICFNLGFLTPATAAHFVQRCAFGVHKTVSYSEKNYSANCKAPVQNGGNDRDIYQNNFMMLSVALQFFANLWGKSLLFSFPSVVAY